MPLIPEFGKQRQEDLFEFKVSLVYGASSRTARATERSPVSNKTKQTTTTKTKSKEKAKSTK